MDAKNAPAMPVFSTTATIGNAKKAKISDVQVYSEDGNALPDTHYFADIGDRGELTLTLSDEMPSGVYLVYTGKKQALAKIKKR